MPKSSRNTAKRLWALDAPTMDMDAGELVVGAEGKVTIPLPAFLIEHDQGLIMFDTSFAPILNEDPYAYFGDLVDVYNVQSHPGQRIDRQIASLGFRPEDITHVILSHTHSDHSGGLYLFPQAKFYIGPGEYDFAADPPADSAQFYRFADDLEPVKNFDWTTLYAPQTDLFGDGAVTIMHTPGHSPGELSLIVELPSQRLVLTGDTVHLREGLDKCQPDPFDWDHDQARASIEKLRRLEEGGARLWIAHDMEDWKHFGALVPQE
ncbi:glyoxylase-like metal-dependent hydrolase (beta-lactamase superfamily II) [Rhodococcus percolatus]|uniref:N-acyl homoserine lactonase family protein n=1 Tax=Rhodococcus opacus TaxID=37919 RepID=UPI00181DA9DD|nr:N-acyl homoserine lactonase family protein [Rhodococcus opacus]MBA8964564.1 glyoxylase-like metal-dependent hydrolase (beta-lactamase superfamily II) [Rhodococcus opacus]MBP2207474.1 glyoxylase-like metal-dependent hydrolase (beta-lactamase superfamily II) [Rhodococcus opacus]MDV6246797.1 N-acyl homoserine lactonase family protein [Rhodococcus opacus]